MDEDFEDFSIEDECLLVLEDIIEQVMHLTGDFRVGELSSDDSFGEDIENEKSLTEVILDEDTGPNLDLFDEMYKDFNEIIKEVCNEMPVADKPIEAVYMTEFGYVQSLIDKNTIVINSFEDKPALEEGSLLFNSDRYLLGPIIEIFGPIKSPFYVILVQNNDIFEKTFIKETAYYAPFVKEFSHFLFPAQFQQVKGSDASWRDNTEPPDNFLDFSDDETERLHKKQLKNKRAEHTELNKASSKVQRKRQFSENLVSKDGINKMINNLIEGKSIPNVSAFVKNPTLSTTQGQPTLPFISPMPTQYAIPPPNYNVMMPPAVLPYFMFLPPPLPFNSNLPHPNNSLPNNANNYDNNSAINNSESISNPKNQYTYKLLQENFDEMPNKPVSNNNMKDDQDKDDVNVTQFLAEIVEAVSN